MASEAFQEIVKAFPELVVKPAGVDFQNKLTKNI
jgi:hypothetical protein